jgi:lysine 2,3-aminomutase
MKGMTNRTLQPFIRFSQEFKSAGRGFWSDVSDADWNDWRWQLKRRVSSLEQLQLCCPR